MKRAAGKYRVCISSLSTSLSLAAECSAQIVYAISRIHKPIAANETKVRQPSFDRCCFAHFEHRLIYFDSFGAGL